MDKGSKQCKKRGYDELLEQDSNDRSRKSKFTHFKDGSPAGDSVESLRKEELCARCQEIDLDAIFQQKVFAENRKFLVDLKVSIRQLRITTCSLCRLFGSISIPKSDQNGVLRDETCHLRLFSANKLMLDPPRTQGFSDTPLLGVVRDHIGAHKNSLLPIFQPFSQNELLMEAGFLYSDRHGQLDPILKVRHLSRDSFNTGFVLDCISYCQSRHRAECGLSDSDPLPNLKLIDCRTRRVIEAPLGCHYVALSYLWGQCESTSLSDAPKVIDDSIEVNLKLNFQYLWIDRYCIDQLNEQDKRDQIARMDKIYRKAEITIIAAAGQDPHHGLPGVRGTLREQQPSLTICSHSLIGAFPHPEVLVKSSRWASRGWTYQEGLLSRRRIIFTAAQVLFECNAIHSAEALVLPLKAMQSTDMRIFGAGIRNGAVDYFKHRDKVGGGFMSYLSDYSKRDLSFPEDAIAAFQGVFNAFRNGSTGVHHFVGIPIHPLTWTTAKRHRGINPEESFLAGLSWYHEKRARRNPHFPSWSWAGWKGDLKDSTLALEGDIEAQTSRIYELNTILRIEEDDGILIRFPKLELLENFLLGRIECQNRFIHIEADTIELSIVNIAESHEALFDPEDSFNRTEVMKKSTYYAKMRKGDKVIYANINPDCEEGHFELTTRNFTGIILLRQSPWLTLVLIVEEFEEWAERVAIFNFGKGTTTLEKQYSSVPSPAHGPHIDTWMEKMPRVRRSIRLG